MRSQRGASASRQRWSVALQPNEILFDRRFFRAQPRVGAHNQFGKARLRFRLVAQESAEDRAEKSEGNTKNSRIFQRENWRPLDEMTRRPDDQCIDFVRSRLLYRRHPQRDGAQPR